MSRYDDYNSPNIINSPEKLVTPQTQLNIFNPLNKNNSTKTNVKTYEYIRYSKNPNIIKQKEELGIIILSPLILLAIFLFLYNVFRKN